MLLNIETKTEKKLPQIWTVYKKGNANDSSADENIFNLTKSKLKQ